MLRTVAILIAGTIAGGTAAIFVKASHSHALTLAGYRCLLAAMMLLPFYLRARRRHPNSLSLQHLRAAWLPGVFLALHFATWIFGVRRTTAANGELIVNMTPLVMPMAVWLLFRETPTGREWVGTGLSLLGVVLLGIGDLNLSSDKLLGDAMCVASLGVMTGYLVLARINARVPSTWLYLVPLYFVAGVACLAAACFFTTPFRTFSIREYAIFAGLAAIPTVLGHSALNYAMRHLPSQLVAIVTPATFVTAGLLGWWFYGERVTPTFWPAAALTIAAIAVAVTGPQRHVR